jgi:two-component sensor histidine kinase
MARDGHVWFAGIDGPIRIPQSARPEGEPAPVSIDAVIANGRSVGGDGTIRLGPGTSRVEFHYTAILPQSPERIRYRYRLDGFDRDWTEPTTAKTADYTNLPAGHYVFHVMAYDMNNPQRRAEAVVGFAEVPHFYRTYWFISLCALLLIGMVVAGHGIYTQQVRAKYRGILQERARVARELHDTLIQGCTTVSALLEASSLTDGTESESLVDHARKQIRSTTEMARRVVWNLRNDEKSHEGFAQTVELIVSSFRKDFNLPVEYLVSGRPIALSGEVEHELRMVMRETLYNAARHAQATEVRLEICYRHDAMEVMLSDDGIGFDVQRVTDNCSDHYGLKGIQERMARIGGKVRIESRAGEGTRIIIRLPRTSLVARPQHANESA